MLKVASDPIDVQDFQFKLQCRLKIFNSAEGILNKNASNLIASASRFGLLFVGCNSPQFKVIRFASVEYYSSPHPVGNYSRREVILPSNPQHISINCDHTILSVVIERDNCPVVIFYDVKSFLSHNITILNEIRLSTTQGVKILAANWHPTVATIFTDCKTDGSLGVYELKGKSVEIKKLPAEATATCFCWSPKGKQIAVGSKDGKLTHYKPDLKAVKVINTPPFEVPHSMISVQWISTFQFIGIFKPLSNSEDQCSIISIDAPKAGNPTFTNFYDICYSNGNFRSPQFYMIFEQHWNILIVASSNSMEVGVLALIGDSWVQWTLPDSARAELPLDENREETYPLGIAIDTSSVKPIPWGESSLQPAPSLLLLSHQGIMCCFKIINLKEGMAGINSPPENLTDLSGSGIFSTEDITVLKPVLDNSSMPPQNIQPRAVQNISHQSSSKQIPKEIKPIQNMFGTNSVFQNNDGSKQTPQIKFQTQIVDSHSSQRALIPNVSQSVDNASLTNLFGGQVTITPANYKEPSSKSMTSTKGSILIKNMNPVPSKLVASDVPVTSVLTTTKSTDQHIISVSTGEPRTQHKVIVPAGVNQVSLRNVSLANQPEIEQEKGEDIEKILNHMIQMECAALEKELKIILFRGKNIRINLDPQIMDIIVNQTRDIDDFIVELIETSESQSSEIHVLKQNTVQSWAWLEEAKSRLGEYQSEELSALLKSKPLDSVSEKHLHTLIQMEYYLDSQLSQAHKALDEQWDKFQEYCRKVNRVQLPTMEAIFQTMVKQNAILQKHDVLLKYIASQIRGKKRIGDQISLFNPLNRNGSLEDSFHNLKLQPEDIYQIYYKKVMNRVKPIPQNKSKQLRRILQNREVSHVKVNSQVPKSILQRTPEKRDTSIFVHMTPTAKPNEKPAKTLNFYQSTPLNITSNPTTQIPKNSALSAFASTNTGVTSAKSSSSVYMSTSSTESGKDNVLNMRSDKGFHAALVKTTENETGNFSFNSTSKSTRNVEESIGILKEKPGSTNFGDVIFRKEHSAAASTSLLGLMLQSKTTFSQSDTKPLFISTKSNSLSTRNENPASCDILRTSSDINIEQSSTSNSASQSILSSAFSKLAPSISTTLPASTTASKSTVAFGVPNSSSLIVKSTEKCVESSCPPDSTKLNLSSSTITVSTSTKSFFTPITSGHLNTPSSSQQVPIVNSSSSKPSAFSPLIMPQSNINNLNTSTSVTTSTNSISIFGKPLIVNSTSSSSSTSPQPTLSTPQQNTISTQLKPISTPNDSTAGLSCKMSIFGKPEVTPSSTTGGSSSFSFLSGIKSTVSSSSTSQVGSNISNITRTEISTGDENALKPVTSQPMLSDSVSTSVNACPSTTNNIQISNTSTSSSIFGTANTTTTEIFGTTVNSSNIFGPKTSNSTIFTSTSNSGSGIFSANVFSPQTTSASQIFGSSSNTTSSIFSTKSTVSPITPSTASSIFGSVNTTSCSILSTSESSSSKTVQSKFNTDTNSSPFSSAGSIFGGSVSGVTSASSSSLFSTTAVTNNKSIFNNMVTSNQQTIGNDMGFATSSSVVTTASTSSTSIFGNVAVSASPFGLVTSASLPFNTSTTSSASVFGGSISFSTPPTSASSTSSFGSSTFMKNNVTTSPFGVPSTSAPIFGSSTTSSSLFGNGSSSVGSNNFGTTPTSSATPFASTSTNTPFGKPVFGQPFSTTGFNTTQTTSPSVFGQSMSGTTSIFGNAFGATTTSSTFGSAPFGTTSSGDNSSLFGSSKNIFGGSNTDNSSGSFGFGSLNVGTSSQNQEQTSGSVTKSPFGGGSFSNSSTTGSIFGSSSFGSTSGGSIFGQSTFGSSSNFGATPQQSGPFTGGAGSVSQAGFGTAPAFQKPAGFGTQSPFGGSPAFGTAPTFGGAPAFGNTSTFGSPNKVFGSASPAGGFGTNSEQSSGFGNLANQNTIGFGNLAQTSNNPGQNTSFSGSSSFSNWR